ncbi:transglycosylase family protein [Streptomyces sp. SP18CS02]|uniref:transglycosylase family protein n=1 Tax=Streptomyces sp. SP18CS02 TaxID=3002531 RepID=UPI002E79813D|nr:transglycosylase family protein [Streptomyces sp. SP18CS02]MEE1755918.1 transglycosylase family protein [Streptomyces sp. SP18CS02]
MRSGNGRHRRPRQAPAIIVAAGVTGSAIALPLLGAGSASAVEGTTWDRVAECESGGMWSADLGNGFYGGLQFSQETWETYGGTAYALRADLASRAQQIAVAEKAYAAQGIAPWETCAPIAGLTDGSAPVAGLPSAAKPSGAPATPAPSASTGTADGADGADGSKSSTPEESTTPAGTASGSSGPAASAKDDPAGDAGTGGGKHRGEPAREAPVDGDASTDPADSADPAASEGDKATGTGNPVNPGTERETGRHASRGDGTARDAEGVALEDGQYTVLPGDNLSDIAETHELPGGWTALYDANKATVGADPDLIQPGQSLDLTAAQE